MTDILERMRSAYEARDAEQFAALFADDYHSSQPAHPGREFEGRAQVLANWTGVFRGVPDFTAELVASSHDGDMVWSEWRWDGHHLDGSTFAMRGVAVLVVRDDLIAEGRLYVEPMEQEQEDIVAAVQELFQPDA
jgi:ketosteroid isomerase-like protein